MYTTRSALSSPPFPLTITFMQTTLNCFFLILPTQLRPKYHLPAKFPSANLLLDVCQSPNSQFSKTEFLLTGLKKQLDKIHNSTRSARNLGFISDEHLTFSDQISAISNACTGERVQYYHIRQLRCIRPYLDSTTACTIATSIVHSKLDYCNSLYYKLPKSQIIRLQLIQLLHYSFLFGSVRQIKLATRQLSGAR